MFLSETMESEQHSYIYIFLLLFEIILGTSQAWFALQWLLMCDRRGWRSLWQGARALGQPGLFVLSPMQGPCLAFAEVATCSHQLW